MECSYKKSENMKKSKMHYDINSIAFLHIDITHRFTGQDNTEIFFNYKWWCSLENGKISFISRPLLSSLGTGDSHFQVKGVWLLNIAGRRNKGMEIMEHASTT